jgi:hypothetical protein
MVLKCVVCGKIDYADCVIVDKSGNVLISEYTCDHCRQKQKESQYRYSDVYDVTIVQKGMPGRRSKNTKQIALFFTPEIPILPDGNRDYLMVDIDTYESELAFIKKGTHVKLSFFWDENKILQIREIGV